MGLIGLIASGLAASGGAVVQGRFVAAGCRGTTELRAIAADDLGPCGAAVTHPTRTPSAQSFASSPAHPPGSMLSVSLCAPLSQINDRCPAWVRSVTASNYRAVTGVSSSGNMVFVAYGGYDEATSTSGLMVHAIRRDGQQVWSVFVPDPTYSQGGSTYGGENFPTAVVVSPDERYVYIVGGTNVGPVLGDASDHCEWRATIWKFIVSNGIRAWTAEYAGGSENNTCNAYWSAADIRTSSGQLYVVGHSSLLTGAGKYKTFQLTAAYDPVTSDLMWTSRDGYPYLATTGVLPDMPSAGFNTVDSLVVAGPGGGCYAVGYFDPPVHELDATGPVVITATAFTSGGRRLWSSSQTYSSDPGYSTGDGNLPPLAAAVAADGTRLYVAGQTVTVDHSLPEENVTSTSTMLASDDAASGKTLWTSTSPENPSETLDTASVAVDPSGERVYTGMGDAAVAHNTHDGSVIWTAGAPAYLYMGPVTVDAVGVDVATGKLYAAGTEGAGALIGWGYGTGYLSELDPKTGASMWTARLAVDGDSATASMYQQPITLATGRDGDVDVSGWYANGVFPFFAPFPTVWAFDVHT